MIRILELRHASLVTGGVALQARNPFLYGLAETRADLIAVIGGAFGGHRTSSGELKERLEKFF
jgi:hypothetical protein